MKTKTFFGQVSKHEHRGHKHRSEYPRRVLSFVEKEKWHTTTIPSIPKYFESFKKMFSTSYDTFPRIAESIEKQNKGRFIYRGMSLAELTNILRNTKFISSPKQKKQDHFDIAEHVVANNSSRFLGLTPSLLLGGTYASMSSIIPSNGAIIQTNLPPFFIDPKELLGTHPELYQRYHQRKEGDERATDTTNFQGISDVTETTAKNTEITMISNFGKTYVGLGMHDVKSIHLLTIPGEILRKWTSIKTPLHEISFENPDYKPRVCAIKTGFVAHDNYLKEEFDLVNRRNIDMGLIPPEGRVITLHEAEELAQSGLLEQINDAFASDNTYVFSHVPSTIPVNDIEGITKFITETIASLPNVKRVGPVIEEITDEEPQGPKKD
ncbi:Uncharacterised protein [Legionella steigerwaltii]|uniref:Uncharacterized protein n=1 Tax=Legionella steigerwaltii TaxID=460 RepID=A0A378LBJ0_9GAMM|nr:hypothetical protein [Legionella steigerwaltii]KTD80077.1 hypothetical protein Lstg_0611 [Legionella steigerwaltii]STY23099.1 Uncharacterised protein [Legionella steigerwaltii]